jgi:hypothetical protein
MQALKQAARENDAARLDALCDTWSLPAAHGQESEPGTAPAKVGAPAIPETEKNKEKQVSETTTAGRP